jgi:hypothetical protein
MDRFHLAGILRGIFSLERFLHQRQRAGPKAGFGWRGYVACRGSCRRLRPCHYLKPMSRRANRQTIYRQPGAFCPSVRTVGWPVGVRDIRRPNRRAPGRMLVKFSTGAAVTISAIVKVSLGTRNRVRVSADRFFFIRMAARTPLQFRSPPDDPTRASAPAWPQSSLRKRKLSRLPN